MCGSRCCVTIFARTATSTCWSSSSQTKRPVVSTNFRDANPEIPWAQIVGLRNRLIHGIDDVDWDVLWDIVSNDLPNLIDALQDLLGESPN